MELWARWVAVVSSAEAAGFLVPAVVGVVTVDLPWYGAVPALVGAGAVEGSMLGWAQARVLGRELRALRRDRWVLATAAGAAVAYLLGVGMGYAGSAATGWLRAVLLPVLAVALLGTLGGAQWLELRHRVAGAGAWVVWTAAGWLLALGGFLTIASPLWHTGQSVFYGVGVGVAAGVVMAVIQAGVTGWGLVRILCASPGSLRDEPLVLSSR